VHLNEEAKTIQVCNRRHPSRDGKHPRWLAFFCAGIQFTMPNSWKLSAFETNARAFSSEIGGARFFGR